MAKKVISKDFYIEGSNISLESLVSKILWTNPNPSALVSNDYIIELSSDDYDKYEVIYFNYTFSDNSLCSSFSIKGFNACLNSTGFPGYGLGAWHRLVEYQDDTHLKLSDCWYFNKDETLTTNQFNVPLYIIGYKTGLFSNE